MKLSAGILISKKELSANGLEWFFLYLKAAVTHRKGVSYMDTSFEAEFRNVNSFAIFLKLKMFFHMNTFSQISHIWNTCDIHGWKKNENDNYTSFFWWIMKIKLVFLPFHTILSIHFYYHGKYSRELQVILKLHGKCHTYQRQEGGPICLVFGT